MFVLLLAVTAEGGLVFLSGEWLLEWDSCTDARQGALV